MERSRRRIAHIAPIPTANETWVTPLSSVGLNEEDRKGSAQPRPAMGRVLQRVPRKRRLKSMFSWQRNMLQLWKAIVCK
jgi:hypothetical protein